ncbi:hypothetical protein B4U79_10977, partial [Dinothrombium tinctorium]
MSATFTFYDSIVCCLMLFISLSIGIYFAFINKKNSTPFEMILGGCKQKTIPVALSLLASFVSSITILGIPAEIYIYGFHFWTITLFFPLVIAVTAFLFVPLFYSLNITSIYQGGIKAVIWTDVFQSVIIIVAMLTVTIKGFIDGRGMRNVWSLNSLYNRTEILDFNPDPLKRNTVWTIGIGLFLNWLSVYSTNQVMFQRYLSLGSLKKAKRSLWILLPLKMAIMTMTCLAGLLIFAKYYDCDPILTKQVSSPDQLYPFYVVNLFSNVPGFTGFMVAAVYSGALSTISSGVNSMSAITLEDFLKPFLHNLTERKATILTKFFSFLYGITIIALIAIVSQMGNVLQAGIQIFGILASPILGLFTLGIFFPSANKIGAFVGSILATVLSLWIGIGANIYKPYVPKMPVSVDGCVDLFMNATGKAFDPKNFTQFYRPEALILR